MTDGWTVLERSTPLSNRWLTVYRDHCRTPEGAMIENYYTVEKPDYVQMVALTEDCELLLVRQYKHGSGRAVVEFPAGYIDGDEEPADAARRELREETGYRAGHVELLGVLETSPAVLRNRAHIFLCRDLTDTGQQELDRTEQIEVLRRPVARVVDGLLDDISSVAALHLALPHL